LWPEPLKACLLAAVICAGSVLVWLGLSGSEPLPRIAPPPLSGSVTTPISPRWTPQKSGQAPPAFVSVNSNPPVQWHWYGPDGCHPAVTLLLPLCDRPTPEPIGMMGR
jgi:hypothetical protein